jgi:hypothetical protein
LGSIVAENGGNSREVKERIQKARGAFPKLKRVWLSKSLQKDTKIGIFNACVKFVLLYECETWLVTNKIQRKIQTLLNRCLRYILKIWWPNIVSNKDLWKVTGQEDINLEIRKFKWIKKKGWRDTKGCPTLEPSGKKEERKTEKQLEKIGSQGSG